MMRHEEGNPEAPRQMDRGQTCTWEKCRHLCRLPQCLPVGASLVAQTVEHLPAVRKTWVCSLGQEDALEKEMATHSSTLAWNIPWMEEPGGNSPRSRNESDTTGQLPWPWWLWLSSC